jgi:hypothetical protein
MIPLFSKLRSGVMVKKPKRAIGETPMKKAAVITIIVFLFSLIYVAVVSAGGFGSARGVKTNKAGGVSGGMTRGFKGQNAAGGQARTFATDGQGNAAAGSASAVRGPNGGGGMRTGGFTRTSDGTVQHKSGTAVSGQAGTAMTQGSFSKDSSGDVNGERNTSVNSQAGNQYQGSTTYNSETGVSHSGKCYDANNNEIPCPSN